VRSKLFAPSLVCILSFFSFTGEGGPPSTLFFIFFLNRTIAFPALAVSLPGFVPPGSSLVLGPLAARGLSPPFSGCFYFFSPFFGSDDILVLSPLSSLSPGVPLDSAVGPLPLFGEISGLVVKLFKSFRPPGWLASPSSYWSPGVFVFLRPSVKLLFWEFPRVRPNRPLRGTVGSFFRVGCFSRPG